MASLKKYLEKEIDPTHLIRVENSHSRSNTNAEALQVHFRSIVQQHITSTETSDSDVLSEMPPRKYPGPPPRKKEDPLDSIVASLIY